jgi:hypothetical protein
MRKRLFRVGVVILVGLGWGVLATQGTSDGTMMIVGGVSALLFFLLFKATE